MSVKSRAIYLRRNMQVASRMMQKHFPEYESMLIRGDEKAMGYSLYARYRCVYNRLNREMVQLLEAMYE